jgi:hypothetical protein
MKRIPVRFLSCLLALGGAALPRVAAAQATIRHPGDHPKYDFEVEPHLAIDPWSGSEGFGPGLRATFVVLDNGFVQSINNSIGVGVGADFLFYGSHCSGPDTHRTCSDQSDFTVPIVLQWNFWLHRQWSVFGEPGVSLHFRSGTSDNFTFDPFALYAGGRFHFSDRITLTVRLGAPFFAHSAFSVGASFLL